MLPKSAKQELKEEKEKYLQELNTGQEDELIQAEEENSIKKIKVAKTKKTKK